MELKDTVKLMESADYKDRFKAEYWQTRIRFEKLGIMLLNHNLGKLNFTPKCSIGILQKQYDCIKQYLDMLEVRAEIEGIDLSENDGVSEG